MDVCKALVICVLEGVWGVGTLAGLSIRPLSTLTGSQDEALGDPIPSYAIDKLFDRFYSLPSRKGQTGSGIGLGFVREVARLHGGQLILGVFGWGAFA